MKTYTVVIFLAGAIWSMFFLKMTEAANATGRCDYSMLKGRQPPLEKEAKSPTGLIGPQWLMAGGAWSKFKESIFLSLKNVSKRAWGGCVQIFHTGRPSKNTRVRALLLLIVISLLIHGFLLDATDKKNEKFDPDSAYYNAAIAYRKGEYDTSLELYKKYMRFCKNSECPTLKRVFAIDIIGTIFIRGHRDPQGLIDYFEVYLIGGNLNDAVEDEIYDWISASTDWIESKKAILPAKDPEELFRLGDYFFQKGEKKKEYPMDRSGNAEMSIAASYFVPYIFQYNNHKFIDRALYKMGVIRSTLWSDKCLLVAKLLPEGSH